MDSNTNPRNYILKMRSLATFGTDSEEIQVWPGQDKDEVAKRIAEGYGAEVVDLIESQSR